MNLRRSLPLAMARMLPAAHAGGPAATWGYLLGGGTVLLASAFLALASGPAGIPPTSVLRILFEHARVLPVDTARPPVWDDIIWQVRLPRVVLAGLVGATLGYAGAVYQGVFRNPLAEPYLIGVAAGAGLGASMVILSPLAYSDGVLSPVPAAAFAGGLIAVALVYAVARSAGGAQPTTLILAGVAVTSIATSITAYITLRHGPNAAAVLSWLLGSFNGSSWSRVGLLAPYAFGCGAAVVLFGRLLNVLQLDPEEAGYLGVDVERAHIVLLAIASLATAAAVSVAGLIGFVGLIVPHAVRIIWGPDYRRLIPLSALAGAAFLILADLLARTLLSPDEVPIGIITSLAGAPFFLWLLSRRRRGAGAWL